MSTRDCHGLLAEFADTTALLEAVHGLHERGYRQLEAYTPYPVDGLAAALDPVRVSIHRRIPFWVLIGGLLGGLGTLALQYYSAVISYPINVGGRPDASWPAFLPAALEMTLLFAALFGVVAMLVGNGLPRLHHPLFAVPRFAHASRAGLFVLLRGDDPQFEQAQARADLDALAALHIDEVPA